MKKSLSIILAIVLVVSLFTGCDKDKKPKVESKVKLTSEYEKPTELVGDPSATGELTISIWGDEPINPKQDMFSSAVVKFKELYPNVNLTVNRETSYFEYGQSAEYNQKKYSEKYDKYLNDLWKSVNTGTGPDLFFTGLGFTQYYQAIKKGSLADMSEYFQNDSSFHIEEYNQAVLQCPNSDGQQFLIPTGYVIPLYASTETLLKETNFDTKFCVDFNTTIDQLYNLSTKSTTIKNPVLNLDCSLFPTDIGIDFIDYDTKTVTLQTNEIKLYNEKIKYLSKNQPTEELYDGEWMAKLKQKKATILQLNYGLTAPIDIANKFSKDENLVIFPLRNANSNITARLAPDNVAVSQSCKDKQIAYNFIKVLLSKDIQMLSEFGGDAKAYIPVSNSALKEYLTKKFLSKENANFTNEISKQKTIDFINNFTDLTTQVDSVALNRSIHKVYYEAMQPYYDNQKSYEECIADAEKKIQAYVFG